MKRITLAMVLAMAMVFSVIGSASAITNANRMMAVTPMSA